MNSRTERPAFCLLVVCRTSHYLTVHSNYFWLDYSTTADLNKMPIVLFGDEGGEHILADDLLQLLQILTYDSEPMVDHDKVSYYKDQEQYQPSPRLGGFKEWVKETFNIDSIDNPDEIVPGTGELSNQLVLDMMALGDL